MFPLKAGWSLSPTWHMTLRVIKMLTKRRWKMRRRAFLPAPFWLALAWLRARIWLLERISEAAQRSQDALRRFFRHVYPWRKSPLFFNLRVLMQTGRNGKAEQKPGPKAPFFSQANDTSPPMTAVSLSIDRRS